MSTNEKTFMFPAELNVWIEEEQRRKREQAERGESSSEDQMSVKPRTARPKSALRTSRK
jgi:hypothetical protein